MTIDQPTIDLVVVPCLSDNYAYLVHNKATGQTALIDAPEAAPIEDALAQRGWTLTDVLITHHHDDHIAGVAALRGGARVVGASADAHRLPPLDLAIADGDTLDVCGLNTHVMDVSGHTIGHIAFHMPQAALAFSADSLMALGCGRLFEGTAEQMWDSMLKFRALPAATRICSGHEYTESNARFALSIDPENTDLISRVAVIKDQRARGVPTVPSSLDEEMRTNPFLRADDSAFKKQLGMDDATDAAMFAEIRARKDKF